jgi:curved DNA-binding protein
VAAAKDYYKILGVPKNATPEQMKKRYRKLAMEYHPDRNKGKKEAEEKFKDINEAYAVLSDPQKRRQYDTFGSAGFHQRFSQEDIFQGFDIGDILKDFGFTTDDVFGSIFGRGKRGGGRSGKRQRSGFEGAQGFDFQNIFGQRARQDFGERQPARGQDLTAEASITLEEAAQGCTRNIAYTVGGKRQSLHVKIPVGVQDGNKLRLAGKGEPGPAGFPPGDLFLVVRVQSHPVFRREQNDLHLEQEIRFTEALLGTSIEVPTLLGEPRKVRVPPGTQPGSKIRLPGLGMPGRGEGKQGDAYVTLRVPVPKSLSKRQRELVEALSREGL